MSQKTMTSPVSSASDDATFSSMRAPLHAIPAVREALTYDLVRLPLLQDYDDDDARILLKSKNYRPRERLLYKGVWSDDPRVERQHLSPSEYVRIYTVARDVIRNFHPEADVRFTYGQDRTVLAKGKPPVVWINPNRVIKLPDQNLNVDAFIGAACHELAHTLYSYQPDTDSSVITFFPGPGEYAVYQAWEDWYVNATLAKKLPNVTHMLAKTYAQNAPAGFEMQSAIHREMEIAQDFLAGRLAITHHQAFNIFLHMAEYLMFWPTHIGLDESWPQPTKSFIAAFQVPEPFVSMTRRIRNLTRLLLAESPGDPTSRMQYYTGIAEILCETAGIPYLTWGTKIKITDMRERDEESGPGSLATLTVVQLNPPTSTACVGATPKEGQNALAEEDEELRHINEMVATTDTDLLTALQSNDFTVYDAIDPIDISLPPDPTMATLFNTKSELKRGITPRHTHGKLNTRHVAEVFKGAIHPPIFGQRQHPDAPSVKVMILVDASGSMGLYWQKTARSAHQLWSSLRLNSDYDLTLWAYDSTDAGTRIQRAVFTPNGEILFPTIKNGGTPSYSAIQIAADYLKPARHKNKLILHITDIEPTDSMSPTWYQSLEGINLATIPAAPSHIFRGRDYPELKPVRASLDNFTTLATNLIGVLA